MDPPPPLESLIGTQDFLPAILVYLKDAANNAPLPVDQVIFQSILLCLIATDKHLIIRTPEEDVSLAVKLTAWMLSAVFNLTTQKIKLKPGKRSARRAGRTNTPSSSTHQFNSVSTSENFLRSIFVQSTAAPPSVNPNHTSQDEASNDEHPRALTNQGDYTGNRTTGRSQPKAHSRRKSYPNSLSATAHAQLHGNTEPEYFPELPPTLPESIASAISTTSTTTFTSTITSPSVLKPQPIYGYSSSSPIQTPTIPNPRLPHAYTDLLTLHTRRKTRYSQSRSIHREDVVPRPRQLPQALVVSGVEHSDQSVQRALSDVLLNKVVVIDKESGSGDEDDREHGTWHLPQAFICVYVCPLDPRERPNIPKSLLDKFAMSTNLFIPQNVRNDFQLLKFTSSSSLPSPRTLYSSSSRSNPASPTSPVHIPLPPSQTPPIHTKPLPAFGQSHAHYHNHSHRHHHRSSTHFSTTASPISANPHGIFNHSTPNSYQTPLTPIRLPLLLPVDFLERLRASFQQTHVAYTLDFYLANLMSAARHNSRLDGTLLTARSMKDAMELARASRVVGTDLTGVELIRSTEAEEERTTEEYSRDDEDLQYTQSLQQVLDQRSGSREPKVLEVSEVDIARIFPRVVSHRVRLRDSPDDEILASALFGATFDPPLQGDEDERGNVYESVKSVLVNILSEV